MSRLPLQEVLLSAVHFEACFEKELINLKHKSRHDETRQALNIFLKRLSRHGRQLPRLKGEKMEMVRNVPEYRGFFPELNHRNAPYREMMEDVLHCLMHNREFYAQLEESVVHEESKNLCQMFIAHKTMQIKEAKGVLEEIELVV